MFTSKQIPCSSQQHFREFLVFHATKRVCVTTLFLSRSESKRVASRCSRVLLTILPDGRFFSLQPSSLNPHLFMFPLPFFLSTWSAFVFVPVPSVLFCVWVPFSSTSNERRSGQETQSGPRRRGVQTWREEGWTRFCRAGGTLGRVFFPFTENRNHRKPAPSKNVSTFPNKIVLKSRRYPSQFFGV